MPLECETYSSSTTLPVPVLFASLSPGTVGVYQVQVRVPPELTGDLTYPGAIQVACRKDDAAGGSSLIALLPVRFDRPDPTDAPRLE
jgi:hypothetical protein